MLVPAQWNGSVEHFYHFFFGYLLPVVLYQEKTGNMAFTVRDCGPMNKWFTLLRPGTDLEFMAPGVMLHRTVTHRQERVLLRGWDDPTRFHRTSLRRFAAVLRDRVEASEERAPTHSPVITILERRQSPTFYVAPASEVYSSGSDFRSWPNVNDSYRALASGTNVSLVDTTELSPDDQIRTFMTTDILLAQHGAGLSNMVFMSPGSSVIEVKPPLLPVISSIYSNLASAIGLGYRSVAQDHEHADVDPVHVSTVVHEVIEKSGSPVPRMTGRLPIRMLRQLPRRL